MYVKLFSQILDSSIADNRALRHFFTDLLLCADGKGYVIMTEGALARRIGATLEEVRWGLAELQKPDEGSKTPDLEGRRIERLEGIGYGWRIVNYEQYRAMKDADQLREATKERVRRHREKKAGNVTVTPGNGSNGIAEAEAEAEAPPKGGKRQRRERERPSREVFDLHVIGEMGMTQNDADHVWNVWEENGWTRSQAGKRVPIEYWRKALATWKTGLYFPSQKGTNGQHRKSSGGRNEGTLNEGMHQQYGGNVIVDMS